MATGKTALVLSAGGMFGAYQAGVWKALERSFRPDMVVGASVGALNGWLIAAGYTGEQLAARWLDPEAGAALKLLPRAGWRNGWFDPEPLRAQAERLTALAQPRIPFGVVTVELPRMRTILAQHPNITPAHLQATCSIPLFLPTVRIDGRRHLDGGFFDKLPIDAALQMGATRIVAIDSLPRLNLWWLRAGINIARLFAPHRRRRPDLEIRIIEPSEPLGDARDAVFWSRTNAERWIALGERDGAAFTRPRPAAPGPAPASAAVPQAESARFL